MRTRHPLALSLSERCPSLIDFKNVQSFDKLRTNGCPGDIREVELRTNGSELAARLLLDLRRVEQRGDDGRRADPDSDARLHQFGAALFVRAVGVVAVVHSQFSMVFGAALEVV
jgi:hypothetical protein